MKKNFLIFATLLAALGLTAFGMSNWTDVDISSSDEPVNLNIKIEPRYGTGITKEDLHRATHVMDILPGPNGWPTYPIYALHVTILEDGSERTESGAGLELTEAQIQLLRSVDYSTNFRIRGNCKGYHKDVPDREEFDLNYHMTVTPEKAAKYSEGMEALIYHLEKNSIAARSSLQTDQLKMGGIYFTINKEGVIADVKLESSVGFPSLDKLMQKLISSAPGSWKAATNAEGDAVDQELYFSFGRGGC